MDGKIQVGNYIISAAEYTLRPQIQCTAIYRQPKALEDLKVLKKYINKIEQLKITDNVNDP